MFRLVGPFILIGIAIAGFFIFTDPLYNDLTQLRAVVASYNGALNNSKMLENERDKLTRKYNGIDSANLAKIQKLLPDNVDNIRLILEIEKIALPYGMILKDVRYDTTTKNNVQTTGGIQASPSNSMSKDYGTWNLEFSTQGTYNNFLNFIKDLEKNLRIVDISSINFSSSQSIGPGPLSSTDYYRYGFKIKTYWLKN